MLNNRTYVGLAVHKGTAYPGEHQAIIDQALWDKVHSILQESPRARACRTRAETPALLKGLLFGPTGRAMSPTHTRRSGGRLYRYYVSQTVLQGSVENCPIRRVSAASIEAAVVDQLRALLRSPEIVVATWRAARPEIDGLSETAVREALERLDHDQGDRQGGEDQSVIHQPGVAIDVAGAGTGRGPGGRAGAIRSLSGRVDEAVPG